MYILASKILKIYYMRVTRNVAHNVSLMLLTILLYYYNNPRLLSPPSSSSIFFSSSSSSSCLIGVFSRPPACFPSSSPSPQREFSSLSNRHVPGAESMPRHGGISWDWKRDRVGAVQGWPQGLHHWANQGGHEEIARDHGLDGGGDQQSGLASRGALHPHLLRPFRRRVDKECLDLVAKQNEVGWTFWSTMRTLPVNAIVDSASQSSGRKISAYGTPRTTWAFDLITSAPFSHRS